MEILASVSIGCLLIGLAAALLMLLNGRISGISGFVGGWLAPKSSDVCRRVAFFAALFSAPWVTCWPRAAR